MDLPVNWSFAVKPKPSKPEQKREHGASQFFGIMWLDVQESRGGSHLCDVKDFSSTLICLRAIPLAKHTDCLLLQQKTNPISDTKGLSEAKNVTGAQIFGRVF